MVVRHLPRRAEERLTSEAAAAWRFAPVTAERAEDLDQFSRAHGKFRYCSCMRWRLRSADFDAAGREGRIAALAAAAAQGQPTGVLAYAGDTPVGWCSIAPRESYQAVLASRVIPAIPAASADDGAVWSVTCFFLAPAVRGAGLLLPLLEAACAYATGRGAAEVEAYPWPGGASYRFMGTRELYLAAGFQDVGPPAAAGRRPVMRRVL